MRFTWNEETREVAPRERGWTLRRPIPKECPYGCPA